jgi:hypothetical protein
MHQTSKWVTRLSRRGIPYQVLERQLPRIPDRLLDCVVYLYPSEAAAEDGEKMGGSGFLVGIHIPYEIPPKGFLICVVTNKHVIDDGSAVVRINTHDGGTDIIALDGHHWFTHPDGDDIAVCPIGLNHLYHKFSFITSNQFAHRGILDMFDVGPGDEVFIPGRFINRDGKQKNTPTVRFGNIAQMPGEPILSDGRGQESYLIEARSIPGFSGAPVFLHFIPEHPDLEWPAGIPNPPSKSKRPKINHRIEPFLLGIDWCHLFDRESPRLENGDLMAAAVWHVRMNTGMMGVIPVWRLWDIFEAPELKAVRDKLAEEVKTDSNMALDGPVSEQS